MTNFKFINKIINMKKLIASLIAFVIVFGFFQTAFALDKENKEIKSQNPKDTIKIYTCTMHPEIGVTSPGKCPICGMDLVLKKTDQQVKTEYTCSMHPDVISDKPGKCPKCGMDLILKGSESGMHMGCMGMMHGGKKNVWMYIVGGVMMVGMMALMVLKVMR